MPPPGNVGFVDPERRPRPGADRVRRATRGLGVSSFASVGNSADITANDLLEYWEEDDEHRASSCSTSSRSATRGASRGSRGGSAAAKPIVVVKSGRSAAGARATTSHTGALLAASDVTVDALFEQAGVIRTETPRRSCSTSPRCSRTSRCRPGTRVGIVTNAGGPAIMCADACEAGGLEVPPLPDERAGRAAPSFLPAEASARATRST